MRIKLEELENPALLALLFWLRSENVQNIVILGGSVRDTIVGERPRDIDIAVCLPVLAPAHVRVPRAIRAYELLPEMKCVLGPLAQLLECNMDDFCREEGINFKGTTIDILGLVTIEDLSGHHFPDIFVDNQKRVFGANSELNVNRIALDATGEIWPEEHVLQLRKRIASLIHGPLGINLFVILRALRTCRNHHLTLHSEAVEVIMEYLNTLRTPERFGSDISDHRIPAIIREVFGDRNIIPSVEDRDLVINRVKGLAINLRAGN